MTKNLAFLVAGVIAGATSIAIAFPPKKVDPCARLVWQPTEKAYKCFPPK